jgi:hypothetical protein
MSSLPPQLEVTLSKFLNWDPQMFSNGRHWREVHFPYDECMTNNILYLPVAVVMLKDPKLRTNNFVLWAELKDAWFHFFFNEGYNMRYLTKDAVDYAIMMMAEDYSHEMNRWLKDCHRYFNPQASNLQSLRNMRERMAGDGPTWWRENMGTYDHGNLVYALPEDLVESEED